MFLTSAPTNATTIIWAIVIVATVIIELSTTNLTSIWFTCGAIVALILSLARQPIWLQLIAFIVVSAALLFSVGKIARQKLRSKIEKTNADAAVGVALTVIKDETDDSLATVKFNGVYWNAVAENGKRLVKGDVVIVQRIEGNKFVVKKD